MKQSVVFDRGSLVFSLVVVLFVLGWRGWVTAHKPPHLAEMADELGSLGEFQGGFWSNHADFRSYPNHANTCLVFGQHTEKGVGIYFCNTTDGKKRLICEQPEKSWSPEPFGMLGWSPDDRLFACALPTPSSYQTPGEILICDGTSGQVVAQVKAEINPSQLAWLTSRSFAYAFLDVNGYYLHAIEQKSEKEWVRAYNFLKLGKGVSGLIGTSAHSVAWRKDQSLWMLDFAAGTPRQIWEATTNQLQSFTYSNETGNFYLTCTNAVDSFQICLRPPTTFQPQGAILNQSFIVERTNSAVLRNEGGRNTFYIKPIGKSEETPLPWPGQILTYQVNGDSLYVTGDRTNEPPGIWRYNFNSGKYDRLVSALDRPLTYARVGGAVSGMFTNSSGRPSPYLVWHPVHLDPGKKYPLIIGQTPYFGWLPYTEIAANGGCYFVLVERPSWFDGLENWGEEVMTAYELMVKNPNVDTNRVYLFGASAETGALSQLLDEKPGLWRGAILFDPTTLPEPSTVRISKLLLLEGADEGIETTTRLTDYQNKAALEGIAVNVALVNGARHIFRSSASEREKTRELARFVFGN